MVELEFKGMCDGCKRAELELKELQLYALDESIELRWEVVCVHELVCKDWNNKLREEKPKNV